ncbi:MAG: YfhO family protein [Bacteroidota bacterium]
MNSANEELAKIRNVNTKTTAVLDGSKFKLSQTTLSYDSLSSVSLLDKKPYWLKYEAQSSAAGLVVFSEIYYPWGWTATIDGVKAPILRADYVLRALEVPAGKHVIEFKFEPKPYVIGNKITMASGWVLLLVLLASLGWSFKNLT